MVYYYNYSQIYRAGHLRYVLDFLKIESTRTYFFKTKNPVTYFWASLAYLKSLPRVKLA